MIASTAQIRITAVSVNTDRSSHTRLIRSGRFRHRRWSVTVSGLRSIMRLILSLPHVRLRIITTAMPATAIPAMAGNMSGEIKLKNFGALAKSIIKWVLGISLTVFTVFLTVQGITSATYDGFSFRAAKYAIGNTVPIIGGFLSGGLDMLVAGSVLIKNSLGSCCILLFAAVIAVPLIQLAVYNLFLKLAVMF